MHVNDLIIYMYLQLFNVNGNQLTKFCDISPDITLYMLHVMSHDNSFHRCIILNVVIQPVFHQVRIPRGVAYSLHAHFHSAGPQMTKW